MPFHANRRTDRDSVLIDMSCQVAATDDGRSRTRAVSQDATNGNTHDVFRRCKPAERDASHTVIVKASVSSTDIVKRVSDQHHKAEDHRGGAGQAERLYDKVMLPS
jgi:hypothetical protein